MSGDLEEAVRMLAADNARMCDILLAAEKLAEQVGRYIKACSTPSRTISPDYSLARLEDSVRDFEIAKAGQ